MFLQSSILPLCSFILALTSICCLLCFVCLYTRKIAHLPVLQDINIPSPFLLCIIYCMVVLLSLQSPMCSAGVFLQSSTLPLCSFILVDVSTTMELLYTNIVPMTKYFSTSRSLIIRLAYILYELWTLNTKNVPCTIWYTAWEFILAVSSIYCQPLATGPCYLILRNILHFCIDLSILYNHQSFI